MNPVLFGSQTLKFRRFRRLPMMPGTNTIGIDSRWYTIR